jgi:hypothetical protein
VYSPSLLWKSGKLQKGRGEQIPASASKGIVCKRKDSPYKVTEKPSRYWMIKNSRYSQLEGREELFERGRKEQVRFCGFTSTKQSGRWAADCRCGSRPYGNRGHS